MVRLSLSFFSFAALHGFHASRYAVAAGSLTTSPYPCYPPVLPPHSLAALPPPSLPAPPTHTVPAPPPLKLPPLVTSSQIGSHLTCMNSESSADPVSYSWLFVTSQQKHINAVYIYPSASLVHCLTKACSIQNCQLALLFGAQTQWIGDPRNRTLVSEFFLLLEQKAETVSGCNPPVHPC